MDQLTWGRAEAGSEVLTAAESLLSADQRRISELLAGVLTKGLLSRNDGAITRVVNGLDEVHCNTASLHGPEVTGSTACLMVRP